MIERPASFLPTIEDLEAMEDLARIDAAPPTPRPAYQPGPRRTPLRPTPMTHYQCIIANIIGSPDNGYRTTYTIDPHKFTDTNKAMTWGLNNLNRSDDFNIGEWRKGRLAAISWMGEHVDDDAELMAAIETRGYVEHETPPTKGRI